MPGLSKPKNVIYDQEYQLGSRVYPPLEYFECARIPREDIRRHLHILLTQLRLPSLAIPSFKQGVYFY